MYAWGPSSAAVPIVMEPAPTPYECSDNPLGYVVSGSGTTYTSSNGCRLGACDSTRNHGYVGKCFEVPDRLKGEQQGRLCCVSGQVVSGGRLVWGLGPGRSEI